MNVLTRLCTLSFFCLMLTMCSSQPKVAPLSYGMTKGEVERLWGKPIEKAPRPGGGEWWYYNFTSTYSVAEEFQSGPAVAHDVMERSKAAALPQDYKWGVETTSYTQNHLKPIGFNLSGRLVELQRGAPTPR